MLLLTGLADSVTTDYTAVVLNTNQHIYYWFAAAVYTRYKYASPLPPRKEFIVGFSSVIEIKLLAI